MSKPKGIGLIVVILVVSFLLAVGVVLVTITGTGPKVAGNIRSHQEAFNAAEAGFDAAWAAIESSYAANGWTSFDGQYMTEPAGVDLPDQPNYFRKLTDLEILNYLDPDGNGTPDVANVIYFHQPYALDGQGNIDQRYTYTTFLLDDEAAYGMTDSSDALLICIGCVRVGNRILSTTRLEVVLAIDLPGTNP